MSAPKQAALVLSMFPPEPWAKALVEAFNQLSLQSTQSAQALIGAGGKYKVLDIKTGASVAASFPIDVKVAEPVKSVRVAMVLTGVPTGAVSVEAQLLSGGRLVRVSNITGLAANTIYSIRLALE